MFSLFTVTVSLHTVPLKIKNQKHFGDLLSFTVFKQKLQCQCLLSSGSREAPSNFLSEELQHFPNALQQILQRGKNNPKFHFLEKVK